MWERIFREYLGATRFLVCGGGAALHNATARAAKSRLCAMQKHC